MHPFQVVLLVLVMGAVICAVWMSVRSSIEERRNRAKTLIERSDA